MCLRGAGELDVGSGRKPYFGIDGGLCRPDERHHVVSGDVRGHGLDPTRAFVQHLVAPRGLVDVRDLPEQNIGAARTAQRQVADLGDVVAALGVENRHDVEDLIAFIGLPDDIALVGGADQFEHLDRIETPTLQVGFAQVNRELRQAGRRLHLDVGRAGDLTERPGNVLRLAIEDIEVVAEDVDHDRGVISRKRLLDAFGQKSHDRGVHADEARKRLADIGLGRLGVVSRQPRLQVHFEFAVVRTPGVFGLLGPPRALRNRTHLGQLPQRLGDMGADAQGLVDGGAGHRRHVDDEVAFLELGNEAAAQKRQCGTSGQRQHGSGSKKRARPFHEPPQQAHIAGAGQADQRRVPRRQPARQQRHGKRRCQCQGDGERGQDRRGVGEPQRSKQPSGGSGQCHHRQHDQNDGECRIDDSAANLERRVEHDPRERLRLRRSAVFP